MVNILAQVKVLVKKDLWTLKSHKKSLFAELVLPVLVTAVAAVCLWLMQHSKEPRLETQSLLRG